MQLEKPQNMVALDRANEIRLAVATLRRQIRSLSPTEALRYVARLLDEQDDTAGATSVYKLLSACPRLGEVGIAQVTYRAQLGSKDRKVRDLTDRQRVALADALVVKAGRYRGTGRAA